MKNKLVADYISIQIIFLMMISIMTGYGAYLLLAIGYTSSTAGILMSCANILCLILEPIVANISDNSKKHNIFTIGIILSWLSLAASIFGYFQRDVSLLTSFAFVALRGIYSSIEPLNNAIPQKLQNYGYEIKFGVGRALGSLSYALTSILVGFLTEHYPYTVVLLLDIISCLLITIAYTISKKHFEQLPSSENTKQTQESISFIQFFKRHKMFVLLMIAYAGIYIGYTMPNDLMILIVKNVGGSENDMGLILGVKAMLEIPVIFFYDKIEKYISNKSLLKIAAIAYSIKSMLFYVANSTTILYIAQLIQPFALALMVPAIVSFIYKIMDKKEAVRGQAIYVMSITVAAIASSTIGGTLSEFYSVKTMLLIGMVISIVSSIVFCVLVDKN